MPFIEHIRQVAGGEAGNDVTGESDRVEFDIGQSV
jgi:hypothetical protein